MNITVGDNSGKAAIIRAPEANQHGRFDVLIQSPTGSADIYIHQNQNIGGTENSTSGITVKAEESIQLPCFADFHLFSAGDVSTPVKFIYMQVSR